MTADQFKGFAREAFETINSLDEIVDSVKGGLDALRVQLGDAVESVGEAGDRCIADCAHRLAAQLKQGGRIISTATDNWSSASRR